MSGFPVILSAPSGAGKTSIRLQLLQRRTDIGYSTSCTTRAPRAGEQDGHDYHFYTREAFEAARDRGEFAEWAEVHGNLYGTLRSEVETTLRSGKHVLPPSGEVLLSRLSSRGTENRERLLTRLRNARIEMSDVGRYHYVVVNDDLARAVDQVSAIIDAEGLRHNRVQAVEQQVEALIAQLEQEIRHFSKGD